jgi:hypothetical protein
MMEAVRASETSVNSYQSTRRYNPEDSHLGTELGSHFYNNVLDPIVATNTIDTVRCIFYSICCPADVIARDMA